MSEWDNFAFSELDFKGHPGDKPLDDLRAAVLAEITTAGQVEPWNLYFYLVRETEPIPQQIRNYLARLSVGQQKHKKASGRRSVDDEYRQTIAAMVRNLYVLRKEKYISNGETKTDAKELAIEDLAEEFRVSVSFIEKLIYPRNKN